MYTPCNCILIYDVFAFVSEIIRDIGQFLLVFSVIGPSNTQRNVANVFDR